MKMFYDFEQCEYISKERLYQIFEQLKKECPCEYNYSFMHFISNCMAINNGSLYTITQRIQQLEKELFFANLDSFESGLDYSDEITKIENELCFAKYLNENGRI